MVADFYDCIIFLPIYCNAFLQPGNVCTIMFTITIIITVIIIIITIIIIIIINCFHIERIILLESREIVASKCHMLNMLHNHINSLNRCHIFKLLSASSESRAISASRPQIITMSASFSLTDLLASQSII